MIVTLLFLFVAAALFLVPRLVFAAVDTTGYLASGNLAVKHWSGKIIRENYENNWWLATNFSTELTATKGRPNEDANAPIVVYNDLNRHPRENGEGTGRGGTGDQLTIQWRNKLGATRVTGNSTLEASEAEPSYAYLKVPIDLWRIAAKQTGVMTEKRVIGANEKNLKMDLAQDAVDKMEEDVWQTAYESACYHLIDLTHKSATAHPNTYYYTNPSSGAYAGSLPAETQTMGRSVLDYAVRVARNPSNPITPIKGPGGKPFWAFVMSDAQWEDAKRDDALFSIMKDAIKPISSDAEMVKHPLFYRAVFYYDSLVIYTTSRVWNMTQLTSTIKPGGATENMHGALLLGARAIGWANGGFGNEGKGEDKNGNVRFFYTPSDSTDYGNLLKRGLNVVNGIVRSDFVNESDSSTKNQTSAIFWTNTSGNVHFM